MNIKLANINDPKSSWPKVSAPKKLIIVDITVFIKKPISISVSSL